MKRKVIAGRGFLLPLLVSLSCPPSEAWILMSPHLQHAMQSNRLLHNARATTPLFELNLSDQSSLYHGVVVDEIIPQTALATSHVSLATTTPSTRDEDRIFLTILFGGVFAFFLLLNFLPNVVMDGAERAVDTNNRNRREYSTSYFNDDTSWSTSNSDCHSSNGSSSYCEGDSSSVDSGSDGGGGDGGGHD
uniref:Uncharacterized protein n=1 Tax=Helicotheca tamesis TaxID=374047 RepID=A0A7S2IIC2_9STRA|mmetsp:Transcript_9713/g.13601  ORF Transcript_9713/g.13601 Transcript_9713/m.13601 type:complete len:191 (+) Transcript_9713:1-573(+)